MLFCCVMIIRRRHFLVEQTEVVMVSYDSGHCKCCVVVSLQGLRNHGQVAQKFTGFMLVVEAQNHMPLRVLSPRDVTARPVGTFTLYGDTLTKFSTNCPNMVTHTSSMPKSEVQVRWTAPPPGSGCVIFRSVHLFS